MTPAAKVLVGLALIGAAIVLAVFFDVPFLARALPAGFGIGLIGEAWRAQRREERIAEQAEAIRRVADRDFTP